MSLEHSQTNLNESRQLKRANSSSGMSNGQIDETAKQILTKLYYDCHDLKKNIEHHNDTDQVYCPRVFDGYVCWPRTPAGTTVTQNCPDFVLGFNKDLLAYKECQANGSWFVHPISGKEWSNYTTCVDVNDLDFRTLVNDIYVKGYILSLTTLLISLVIFLSFRTLRCTRIRIHIQLFSSLALSCSAWLIWYNLIDKNPSIIADNSIWCVGLHIILYYLMLANYFWMFCEGLHLHLVLVVVFVKDSVAMQWFLFIGWLAPIILVFVYAEFRVHVTQDAVHCWTDDSPSMWILKIPVLVSLLASIVFLINVVRVLCSKLHPGTAQLAPLALRKALRATLILVPLFGLHYILLPFQPEPGSSMDKVYQITSALLISLQGVCVSCLFCFANHDVLHEMRNLFIRLFPTVFQPIQLSKFDTPQATQTRDVVV